MPRPGTSLYCAPKIPDLTGLKDRKFLGATGLYRNAGTEDLMRYAILETGLDEHTQERLSDAQVYALVLYINSFRSPPNSNRLDKYAKTGLKIFEREGCPTCHPPPRYTNDQLIPVNEIRTDPCLTTETRKATGSYWYRRSKMCGIASHWNTAARHQPSNPGSIRFASAAVEQFLP